MPRKLRIAVSVFFGLATVALCVLWVRSFWLADFAARTYNGSTIFHSNNGYKMFSHSRFHVLGSRPRVRTVWAINTTTASGRVPERYFFSDSGITVVVIPYSVSVILAAACAAAPFAQARFSLRTLLIATTLVAVVLGLAVWAGR